MARQAYLHPRLSSGQLQERFRNCRDLRESRRWQLLWFISLLYTLVEAATLTSFSERYARLVLQRYNRYGIPSVKAKLIPPRKPRNPPLLTPHLCRLLGRALCGKAPDGGLWTGPKVAKWISQKIGRKVAPQRGWDYLKRLGRSLQAPRPRHIQASILLQERFKKNSGVRSNDEELKNQESA